MRLASSELSVLLLDLILLLRIGESVPLVVVLILVAVVVDYFFISPMQISIPSEPSSVVVSALLVAISYSALFYGEITWLLLALLAIIWLFYFISWSLAAIISYSLSLLNSIFSASCLIIYFYLAMAYSYCLILH